MVIGPGDARGGRSPGPRPFPGELGRRARGDRAPPPRRMPAPTRHAPPPGRTGQREPNTSIVRRSQTSILAHDSEPSPIRPMSAAHPPPRPPRTADRPAPRAARRPAPSHRSNAGRPPVRRGCPRTGWRIAAPSTPTVGTRTPTGQAAPQGAPRPARQPALGPLPSGPTQAQICRARRLLLWSGPSSQAEATNRRAVGLALPGAGSTSWWSTSRRSFPVLHARRSCCTASARLPLVGAVAGAARRPGAGTSRADRPPRGASSPAKSRSGGSSRPRRDQDQERGLEGILGVVRVGQDASGRRRSTIGPLPLDQAAKAISGRPRRRGSRTASRSCPSVSPATAPTLCRGCGHAAGRCPLDPWSLIDPSLVRVVSSSVNGRVRLFPSFFFREEDVGNHSPWLGPRTQPGLHASSCNHGVSGGAVYAV